jgi:hypothetical protein
MSPPLSTVESQWSECLLSSDLDERFVYLPEGLDWCLEVPVHTIEWDDQRFSSNHRKPRSVDIRWRSNLAFGL